MRKPPIINTGHHFEKVKKGYGELFTKKKWIYIRIGETSYLTREVGYLEKLLPQPDFIIDTSF